MPTSLVDLLELRAEEAPDATLYRFLETGDVDGPVTAWTRADLHRRAVAVARALDARPGDRALLLFPAGLDFIGAFFGCLAAGVLPVPVAPPDPARLGVGLGRLTAIAQDAAPAAVLTTQAIALMRGATPTLRELPWIAVNTLPEHGDTLPHRPTADQLAFLQYTSGSTGDPRGVQVSHGNLMHNLSALQGTSGLLADDHLVSWLPMFHDLGLIGMVLYPLYAGSGCTFLSPHDFLRRPARWVEAVHDTGASVSTAPDFGFALVTHRTTPEQRAALDLSRWRMAGSGAEPVHADTIDRFCAAFAPAGFRRGAFCPIYGLAEHTLGLAGRAPTAEGGPTVLRLDPAALDAHRVEPSAEGRSIVGCGRAAREDIELLAVDPETRQPTPPDRVGELWVRSPSVAKGYRGQPERSAEVFEATLADGEGPWLRTGDLGFLRGGEVFITGRLKDLIIVAGRNLYPQDIERTVAAAHPALRAGGAAAFGVDDGQAETLAVVAELRERVHPDSVGDEVAEAIVEAVVREHGVAPSRVALLRARRLPKTSSGKVRRQPTRRALLDGTLRPVRTHEPSPPVETPAVDPFEEVLASALGRPLRPGDLDRSFAALGLDSAGQVGLAGALELALGRPVPTVALFEHPSPRRLAGWLAAEADAVGLSDDLPADEPVAIVGMACRFPGGADDPESLWTLLLGEVDPIGPVPAARWDNDALLGPPRTPGRTCSPAGGFIEGIEDLDADFFGLTGRAADRLDPQQRLALELGWEALEHAGLDPSRLRDAPVGVTVGASGSEFAAQSVFGPEGPDAWAGTGAHPAMIAGRLAHVLGTRGPAMTVDTACSSGLVAVLAACRDLRDRACRVALAGAVNVLLRPEPSVFLSQLGVLSPSGRCRSFAADADGYVRAEGGAMVVLKRLADAKADGDDVIAVIRGGAVNHDGASNGLTAPSGEAQEAVLRAALARARVRPGELGFVEAHGTGTVLGDAVELRALGRVFGAHAPAVGSVKTRLGHLEAAAGLAGLLRAALAVQRGVLPPDLHRDAPAEALTASGLRAVAAPEPWGGRRVAGVSSFGLSGTNAHLILTAPAPHAPRPRPAHVVALSAADPDALEARRAQALDALQRHDRDAVFRGATQGRAGLPWRLAATGDLARAAPVHAPTPAPLAFIFPGQGAQIVGMGQALYEAEPAFREALDRCAALMDPHLPAPLRPAMFGDAEALGRTVMTQPALFALGWSLAWLLEGWGVRPAAVVGLSLGELTAACVAGALSLEEACRVVTTRALAVEALPEGGASAGVALSEAEARALVRELPALSLAAVNGPRRCVLSGPEDAVAEALRRLAARGRAAARLETRHAFHSPLIEPALQPFLDELGPIEASAPRVPLISTLSGQREAAALAEPAHWARQLREPVRFHDAVRSLVAMGVTAAIELGPRPVLTPLVARAGVPAALRPPTDPDSLAALAARLHTLGHTLDWRAVQGPGPRAPLPPYPFQRRRHWFGVAPPPSTEGWVHLAERDPAGGLVWRPCPRGPSPLHAHGRYLITGGTGGIGRRLALWLAERFQARLELVGRTPAGERHRALLAEVEARGGQAHLHAVDLRDPAAARALVEELGPVDGLFHLAGGPDAIAAKTEGLRNLDGLEAGFRCLFSSISALLPALARGIEPYAEANAWLDRAARERAAAGQRVVSVQLAPWAEVGQAADVAAAFAERGITPIPPALGLAAVEHALSSGQPVVVVLDRRHQLPAPAALPADLEARVRTLVARVARLAPEDLDPDATFTSLGVDSVQALDVVRDLEALTGRGLPTTLLYEAETLNALLAALRGRLQREEAPLETEAPLPGLPLLPAQQTFVVQRRFFPDMPGNVTISVALQADSPLDLDRLQTVLDALTERHPALGSVLRPHGGRWRQHFGAVRPVVERCEPLDEDALINRPFDLERGPLVRVHTDGRRLILNGHHAVVDAWSQRNVLVELLEGYEALRQGQPLPWPPLEANWTEAAEALRRSETGDLSWWTERFGGGVPPLHLDWTASVHEPAHGGVGTAHRRLDPDRTAALEAAAQARGVTLPALVLAAYMQALFDASGQHDVTVRVAHGRREVRVPDVTRIVGSFADSLPVRAEVAVGEPLLDLAARVQAEGVAVRGHAQASSMALASMAERSPAGPVGLTPAGFSFPKLPAPEHIGGLEVFDPQGAAGAGFTRIALLAWVFRGSLHTSWSWARSHLDATRVQSLAERVEAALDAVLHPPAPLPETLHGRVLATCRAHPERIAVWPDLRYGDLDRRSAALAARLSGPRIAVLASPSPDAVIALLAVLRSGAAYVPLDPRWPDPRIAQVAGAAKVSALICPGVLVARARRLVPGVAVLATTVGLGEWEREVRETSVSPVATPLRPSGPFPPTDSGASSDLGASAAATQERRSSPEAGEANERSSNNKLAYIMFTSGSTGAPKGVMVDHAAVLCWLEWVLRVFGVTPQDRFAYSSSLSYGGSLRQIWAPLLAGAQVHPLPLEVVRDPEALLDAIEDQGLTVWNSVPSLWGHLIDAAARRPGPSFTKVRWMLVGGEAVPADLVRRWRRSFPESPARLVNLYGSTETIVNATFYEVTEDPAPDQRHTPIGWSRAGVETLLLDPVDGVGELVVRGAIARGYFDAPEQTAAAFVDHPTLGRVYRMGDLARQQEDGAFVYLGRRDTQVQIHGNRVELSEVEHELCNHPDVAQAVVVYEGERLRAAVESSGSAEGLRGWLAERLPPYMVPTRIVALDALPRNPAGKADRRAVAALLAGTPAPPSSESPAPSTSRKTPPRGGARALLADAWQRVLDLPTPPGEADHFFALGGDSIRALEVLDRLRPHLRAELRPMVLYQYRTLGALADALDRLEARAAPAPTPSASDDGPAPLGAVQRGFLAAHLRSPDRPPTWCARVPLEGEPDLDALRAALRWLVARHPQLRTVFDPGPPPTQRALPAMDLPLQYDDLSALPPDAQSRALDARWDEETCARFDVTTGPLARLRLIRLGRGRHSLLLTAHHLISDAWSAWLLAAELLTAHDALAAGRTPELPPPPLRYADLVARESFVDDRWWRGALAGLTQGPGPEEPAQRATRVVLGEAVWSALKRRAREASVSPYQLALAALFETLMALLETDDVVVATAITGRDSAAGDVGRVVGAFARGLPVRVKGEPSLPAVAAAFTEAAAHSQASPMSMGAALGARAPEILGRFFLTWQDPSAVPAPDSRLRLRWDQARSRFATASTRTELMVGAVATETLSLNLYGGALVDRAAPTLERRLRRMAGVDAALLIYAPSGVQVPLAEPTVVERVEGAGGVSELVLLPMNADELSRADVWDLVQAGASATSAPIIALAGMLPATTGLGARGLADKQLTTGHAATVAAIALNLEATLAALGWDWSTLTVGVLGYGAIGRAALALAQDRLGAPAALRIQDPSWPDSASVVGCDVILGATSGGRALDVATLPPGTVVLDDSFPLAFDPDAARARMLRQRDVLLLGAGTLDAGPLARTSPFPQAEAVRARFPAQLMPGCHAEAMLLAFDPALGPTVGPVTLARARAVMAAVEAAGWRAAPLHLGAWAVPEAVVAGVRGRR
ncbi:MAG: SDR family NAD(P)-dependent oxidoreductase [Alphaproteobacteria bacterium]|nr:SDR family NAD(P)-dependent oxidoreductase [Alphaproteobacteria bacterium]